MSFLLGLWSKVKGWLGWAAVFLGAFVTVWFSAKRVGRAEQKVDDAEDDANHAAIAAAAEVIRGRQEIEAKQESIHIANEVLNENAIVSDDAVINRLRDKWQRD